MKASIAALRLVFFAAMLLVALPVYPQTNTGEIVGVVKDSSGRLAAPAL